MTVQKLKKLFFVIYISFSAFAFSQQIVNPIAGKWNNLQSLVVDMPQGCNAYFSFGEQDPLQNGLVYDGPVEIEMTEDIHLNVAFVFDDGTVKKQEVSYYVEPFSTLEETESSAFLSKISSGIVDYVAGEVFEIPQQMKFQFSSDVYSYEAGTALKLPAECVAQRFVGCTLTDGSRKYRFVMRILPSSNGIFSRKDVPFEIRNWNEISFTDKSFIYKIDDQWWKPAGETVELDSSVSHMISWQNIDYSAENPVKFFVLPAKPKIISSIEKYGVKKLSFDVDKSIEKDFKMGILDSALDSQVLFDSLLFDTFPSDHYKGSVEVGFFFDSVLLAKKTVSFDINRKRPSSPKITSSSESEFSRKNVTIDFSSSTNDKIFYKVFGPVSAANNTDKIDFDSFGKDKDFQFLEYNNVPLVLSSVKEGANVFVLRAYCQDLNGNISDEIQAKYIIDNTDFYIDSSKKSVFAYNGNGTKDAPFTSFEQVMECLPFSRYLRVHVKGIVSLPDSKISINTNCSFVGEDDARLVLGRKTQFEVKNASLTAASLIFELSSDSKKSGRGQLKNTWINVDRGVLDFSDCIISNTFQKAGTLINAANSVVNFRNCQISINSLDYASVVSSFDSKINISSSHFAAVSNTCVLFSISKGIFNLNGSECMLFGNLGRVAELFGAESSIKGNVFSAELSSQLGVNQAIFEDEKNKRIEYSENSVSGF